VSGWFVLAFGLLLIGVAVRGIVGERRAARRGRRQVREDLLASVALLLVIGGVALLLGLAMLLVFPRN
jgi:xanthine/uracil permease